MFEAGPHLLVEAGHCGGVEAWRHSAQGENHFAETRTVSQELQGHLRVRKLPQRLENVDGFPDPVLRVLVAVLRGTYRGAEKLKVAVPYDFEVGGEGVNVDSGSGPGNEDEFALVFEVGCASAEPKSNVFAAAAQTLDSVADH